MEIRVLRKQSIWRSLHNIPFYREFFVNKIWNIAIMNLFIQSGKLFSIMICMTCCIFCFAADNTEVPPHVYNYITAATFFPVTSLENNAEYSIRIMEQTSTESISTVKVLITPGNIVAQYSIDRNGIVWEAEASRQGKRIFSVSLSSSRSKLFPANLYGNWAVNIESIILNGLKYFSVGRFFLNKKNDEMISLHVLSSDRDNIRLQIGNTVADYGISNGVKKMRVYERQNGGNKFIGELTLFDENQKSKLDGMLLSYEFKDDIQPSLVYYAPLKLRKAAVLYVKDYKPYVKVYNTSGKIIQEDTFFKIKPSPFDYWIMESGKQNL